MMTDWAIVYMQERRRPGYVINNSKSIPKAFAAALHRRDIKPSQPEKRKAA
jgi:hypothetical protein